MGEIIIPSEPYILEKTINSFLANRAVLTQIVLRSERLAMMIIIDEKI
jgi:hypothetical protein